MYAYQPFPVQPMHYYPQHPQHPPPLHSLALPRPGSYKPFPSPATSGDSPTKPAAKASNRPSTSGSGDTRDRSLEADGSDDEQAKLEVRREKNRVKQRNLRLRRANHIADLETALNQLQGDHNGLKDVLARSQQREAQLEDWIRDLEQQLGEHGFASEVDALRYRHVRADTVIQPKKAKRAKRDTLSTLAHAAASITPMPAPRFLEPPHSAPSRTTAPPMPTPMPSSHFRQAELDKKRKRDIDGPLVPPPVWDRQPLAPMLDAPSPSIRIENLLSPQAPLPEREWPQQREWAAPPPLSATPVEWQQDLIPFHPVNYPVPSPSPPESIHNSIALSTPHPSVLTARSLLLHLFPQPLPFPLPSIPPMGAGHQQIILIALSHLSPPHVTASYRARQFHDLSPGRCKAILEYESSPFPDPRLVLFPIVVLRARIIQLLRDTPFDLSAFIDSTLEHAVIFGDPSDPDAWEMPDAFWDIWGHWMPLAKSYCHSLKVWRRRDGHMGATVAEMLLGLEGDGARRKDGPVGKPPGWRWENLLPEEPSRQVEMVVVERSEA